MTLLKLRCCDVGMIAVTLPRYLPYYIDHGHLSFKKPSSGQARMGADNLRHMIDLIMQDGMNPEFKKRDFWLQTLMSLGAPSIQQYQDRTFVKYLSILSLN